jgi:lipopolysaccharide transport system permease protein
MRAIRPVGAEVKSTSNQDDGSTRESVRSVIVTSRPPTVKEGLRKGLSQRELLWNLTLRDLRTRYRRSALGWGWSLVNPLVTTLVYSFVFAVVFKAKPAPGNPSGIGLFAIFLLSAVLPWTAFTAGASQGVQALIGGSSMMGKVNFPREHLVIGSIMATMISFTVELSVLAVVVLVLGHGTVLLYLPVTLFVIVLLALFTGGIALWLAALNVRFRDVQHLIGVAFLVWFYLTPVLYSPMFIPLSHRVFGQDMPLRKTMLTINPMARFVEAFRNIFYDVRSPRLAVIVYLAVVSLSSVSLGYRFFIRRSGRFIEDM